MTQGEQRRDWVYVTDIVDGLTRAATIPDAVGGTFNLCTGCQATLFEVASLIVDQFSAATDARPISIQRGALPYRDGEIWQLVGDNGRARNILGWQPHVKLQEGIRRTVEAALQSLD
jgi:nucleoside-diphosphate-sugar epimerase